MRLPVNLAKIEFYTKKILEDIESGKSEENLI